MFLSLLTFTACFHWPKFGIWVKWIVSQFEVLWDVLDQVVFYLRWPVTSPILPKARKEEPIDGFSLVSSISGISWQFFASFSFQSDKHGSLATDQGVGHPGPSGSLEIDVEEEIVSKGAKEISNPSVIYLLSYPGCSWVGREGITDR